MDDELWHGGRALLCLHPFTEKLTEERYDKAGSDYPTE
jgi:hypothetical protein